MFPDTDFHFPDQSKGTLGPSERPLPASYLEVGSEEEQCWQLEEVEEMEAVEGE